MGLGQGRFGLGIRREFFTSEVAEHWSRLLRKVVMASGLPEFRKRLKNTLRPMM